MDPNGPNESRLVTMRSARTGPIHGSASISARVARSRSTCGLEPAEPRSGDAPGDAWPPPDLEEPDWRRSLLPSWPIRLRDVARPPEADRLFPEVDLIAARTLSTAERWSASACRSDRLACTSVARERTSRTDAPSRRRTLRNRRALRSGGVTRKTLRGHVLVGVIRLPRVTSNGARRHSPDRIAVFGEHPTQRAPRSPRSSRTPSRV